MSDGTEFSRSHVIRNRPRNILYNIWRVSTSQTHATSGAVVTRFGPPPLQSGLNAWKELAS